MSKTESVDGSRSSHCYVAVDPVEFWFRAWYRPADGTLQLTRSRHLTKQGVIDCAEQQFGVPWREIYAKGVKECGRGSVTRAVKCVIHLGEDSKFRKAT